MYIHTYHWYLNKKKIERELPLQGHCIEGDKKMIDNRYIIKINNTVVLTV